MRDGRWIEQVLGPGEFRVARGRTRLRTLLGSCVAITLWQRELGLGAMCHFLVPERGPAAGAALDPRFGDDCLALLRQTLDRHGTRATDCEFKIFGGGDMFPACAGSRPAPQVGARNVLRARQQLAALGAPVVAEHTGGAGHRVVVFEVWTGRVWLRHDPLPSARSVAA